MDTTILRQKKILFAEDEHSVRWATRLLLDMDQHSVVEADSGDEALGLYSPGRFDLVITDFQMPRMCGNELAAKIKTLSPGQPILMITAYGDKMAKSDLPVDATLAKPFTFEQLRGAIARLLGADVERLFFVNSPATS